MPVKDGEYIKLTQEEIQQRFEANLEAQLDTTAQPGDLVLKQLKAEAKTLAQNQEDALKRVHRAAYLADASGKELDKVVDLIGLSRQDATPATGTVRLWRETPPSGDYVTPSGSVVQTPGTEPIKYETTERGTLAYIDGFETNDLTNWKGDTASFPVITTGALVGNYSVEIPATSGVNIRTKDSDFAVGTTFNLDFQVAAGTTKAFRFGVQDDSNYFEVVLHEGSQDLDLRLVEGGAESAISNNSNATIPAGTKSHLEIEWGLYDPNTATIYESDKRETEVSSVSLSDNPEWESGAFDIVSKDATATGVVDEVTTRSVHVNIEAVGEGTQTNVGPNTITDIASGITGVEEVTNPVATGNPNRENTAFEPFVLGEEREDDEQLRGRAFNSTAIGGAATVNAISTELKRIDGVRNISLNRNREETVVNGLPSHSFEAVVYGGADEDIANTIFDTASIDSHDVGGVNGQAASYDIVSDVTNSTETIRWSRPYTLNLKIEVDLIVDDTFIGEEEIKSIITNYIGGTDLDGNFVNGLQPGEDIYEAVLSRKVVNPEETGVWEVDTLFIDKNNDGTDDTTTTASDAEILAVADNEVAVTNARDGSITITTTPK